MAALNYAKEYQANLEQAFPYVLNFGRLYQSPSNSRISFIGAKTIAVPTILTTGRTDANRDTIGQKKRNYDNDYTEFTLKNFRSWETLVHPRDIAETKGAAAIGNITQVYNEEQKFPEMDAYCVSKIFNDWTELSMTAKEVTLTTENVLTTFDSLMERMDNKRVPMNGRVLYVTPSVKTLLKNADKIQRTIDAGSANSALNRAVSRLDEVELVSVPEELMRTVYDFTVGWKVADDAKQIRMFLINPLAVITPMVYNFAQLDEPSAGTQGKYDYYEESYEDVFVLPLKKEAIQFVIDPAA
ncbi:MAG: capsid protein [Lachnospiraceae bacterium]|nr:capsid protein [Lachnospiraceae bacterium]